VPVIFGSMVPEIEPTGQAGVNMVTEQSRTESRLLVISAATSYGPNDLEPFLRSLYEHCPHATVVLVVNADAYKFQEALESFNKNVVLVSLPDRYLRRLVWSRYFMFFWNRYKIFRSSVMYASTKLLTKLPVFGQQFTTCFISIAFARNFFAKDLLLNRYKHGDFVLICDSRDVFFQGDPLTHLAGDLVSGLESCTINECRWNRQWIDRNYGDEGLSLIGDHQAVCSGVTIGKRNSVLVYLEAMCSEISAHLQENSFKWGGDQGIHNWIIRTHNRMKCTLISSGHRLIATLNDSDLETYNKLDEKRGLLNKELEPVMVVHQYDRKEVVKDWCLKRWTTNRGSTSAQRML
jgi:hypothetical protein